ncbi:MAG: hypothetical protein IT323_21805, partial [Anaerolineae bacterium]|nr:hypothetical protein [Anaerolineae bacterium]
MGRSLPGRLILIGIGLLLCGLGLLLNDTAVAHAESTAESARTPQIAAVIAHLPGTAATSAQRQETPEYVGAEECSSCHRNLSRPHGASQHALALQDTGRDKDPILADFEQAGDLLTLQFPGEDAPRAVTPDDIEYAVGVGRYAQNYLVRIARNDYAVLPATWNAATNAWQPLELAENWPDPAYDWEDNCAYCHTTGLNIENDRWVDDGVQCESCHGPASAHVEAARDAGRNPSEEELLAVRGTIVLTPDSQVCGQCHSQGTDNATGRPYPTTYLPGGDLLAGFTLVPTDDPVHWWPTGHARDKYMQYNEWLVTTHASALDSIKGAEGANERCLTCHSADSGFVARLTAAVEAGERSAPAPDAPTLETAQFGVACVACHNPHAAPPDAAAQEGDEEGDDEAAEATAEAAQATAEATTEATAEADASTSTAAAAAAQAQSGPSVSSDNLRAERYELCTSCHRLSDDSPGIHFAVKEMYEGATIVDVVQGIPSPHKTVENGPDCVACHMANTPIDAYGGLTEGSHTMKPADPALVNPDGTGPQDSCTNCHTDLSPEAMRTFIEGSQEDTQKRLNAAEKALTEDSPTWVRTVLDFVIGDGSLGIHNHRYTAALLDAVEIELGITTAQLPAMPSNRVIQDPATCAECHQDQHRQWLTSPHAQASQNMNFREEYARLRQPTFCMGCHGSGFSEDTGAFLFEG